MLVQEFLKRIQDAIGIDALILHLLPESARTFSVGPDVVVASPEPSFQQFRAESGTQSGVDVKRFGHQNRGALSQSMHHVLVVDV